MHDPSLQVIQLRCEHLANPLGIDVAQPRLSWAIDSDVRGQRQTAYQIRVASRAELLAEGQADLWDSGVVASDQSAYVPYAGAALRSGQRCWWQVCVWGLDGQPSDFSAPAWWELGLLERADWQAQWVGAALAGGAYTTSPAPYLRTRFTLGGQPIASARLYSTALGLYEPHLNGQVVGGNVLAPGWTDYAIRVQYQAYDVTSLLRPGENVLGAILGDGWYCGHVAWLGRQRYGDRPWLLAQLVITFADGSTQTIASGAGWQVSFGPILEADLLMGESYDARRELAGWDTPGYDAARWQPAEILPDPGIALSAMRGPPVRRIAELAPVAAPRSIKGDTDPKWIFDLGQNMVGRLRLRLSGPAGTTVTLRHAEALNPDGTLYTANLRSARQADHYTLRGGGEETWEPRFTFHGFRYAELSGYPGTPTVDTLTGVVLHSAMEQTGSFACSDPLINQLQHNIEWGQRGNFVDVPTDCPQRDERLGWTGDAQVFIRTAAFNFDVAGLFARWMRDVEDAQTPAGTYPRVVPNPLVGAADLAAWPPRLADGGPAWADAGIICPWTLYLCYGDVGVLAERYASMQRYVEFLNATSRDGLRCYAGYAGWHGHGDWLALDGATDRFGNTPKELLGTAFFAHSSHLLAKIAGVLGKHDDAARYQAMFERVRLAFQQRFVTPGGLIGGGTQTGYVLALHFELLPAALRPAALAELVRDIERRGDHLSTGFVGTPYIAWVLSEHGRADVAYRLLKQTSWPSWLYSVTQGATTIWERWDGWTHEHGFQSPGMNSFNHYAYGAIGDWLYAVVAGIDCDPAQPGYKHIIMHPRIGGGLTSAGAELRTLYGLIRSAWQISDGKLSWRIRVPANTSATVYVPAQPEAEVREGGRPAAEAAGVRPLRRLAEAAVFAVGAGDYHFEV